MVFCLTFKPEEKQEKHEKQTKNPENSHQPYLLISKFLEEDGKREKGRLLTIPYSTSSTRTPIFHSDSTICGELVNEPCDSQVWCVHLFYTLSLSASFSHI